MYTPISKDLCTPSSDSGSCGSSPAVVIPHLAQTESLALGEGVRPAERVLAEELAEELDAKIDTLCSRTKRAQGRQLAKALIKAFEPEKPRKYPYNGGKRREEAVRLYGLHNPGALSKAPWWPENGCRYKEPDHLKKPERMLLIKHLLRIVPCAVLRGVAPKVPSQVRRDFKAVYRVKYLLEQYERGEIDWGFKVARTWGKSKL